MNQATVNFILEHADDDVRQLALRGTKNPEVELTFALDQIAGRQTARRKLPSWAATEGIVYPPHLSMEQCSSEQTARYKAQLCKERCAACGTLVDLTGGFGVDFSLMAAGFQKAVYVERQEQLCAIARDNFRLLGLSQAEVHCGDSSEYLQQMKEAVDVIFLDPARRDSHGGRTYGIGDCTPNVLELRDLLLQRARMVVIKLSPMLDWRKAVSDLGEDVVSEVHIVSVGNECKELLVVMAPYAGACRLVCVNDESRFEVSLSQNCGEGMHDDDLSAREKPVTTIPQAGQYLYEPNASVMKAGCFEALSQCFGVSQIAQNSHLFIADEKIASFPGRSFVIDGVTSMNKRELKEQLKGLKQANITVRNFPLSVAELRKRLKLSEGGSMYVFATTLAAGDRVLLVSRKSTI